MKNPTQNLWSWPSSEKKPFKVEWKDLNAFDVVQVKLGPVVLDLLTVDEEILVEEVDRGLEDFPNPWTYTDYLRREGALEKVRLLISPNRDVVIWEGQARSLELFYLGNQTCETKQDRSR